MYAGNVELTSPNEDGTQLDKETVRVIPSQVDWGLVGDITEDSCKYFWGSALQGMTAESNWEHHIAYLSQLKEDMKKATNTVLEDFLGDQAYNERIKTPTGATAASVDQIMASWKADGSRENAEKVWNVLYGSFDLDRDGMWEMLERRVMCVHKLQYQGVKSPTKKRIKKSPAKSKSKKSPGKTKKTNAAAEKKNKKRWLIRKLSKVSGVFFFICLFRRPKHVPYALHQKLKHVALYDVPKQRTNEYRTKIVDASTESHRRKVVISEKAGAIPVICDSKKGPRRKKEAGFEDWMFVYHVRYCVCLVEQIYGVVS